MQKISRFPQKSNTFIGTFTLERPAGSASFFQTEWLRLHAAEQTLLEEEEEIRWMEADRFLLLLELRGEKPPECDHGCIMLHQWIRGGQFVFSMRNMMLKLPSSLQLEAGL